MTTSADSWAAPRRARKRSLRCARHSASGPTRPPASLHRRSAATTALASEATAVRPGVSLGRPARTDFERRDAEMGRHTGFRRSAGPTTGSPAVIRSSSRAGRTALWTSRAGAIACRSRSNPASHIFRDDCMADGGASASWRTQRPRPSAFSSRASPALPRVERGRAAGLRSGPSCCNPRRRAPSARRCGRQRACSRAVLT